MTRSTESGVQPDAPPWEMDATGARNIGSSGGTRVGSCEKRATGRTGKSHGGTLCSNLQIEFHILVAVILDEKHGMVVGTERLRAEAHLVTLVADLGETEMVVSGDGIEPLEARGLCVV